MTKSLQYWLTVSKDSSSDEIDWDAEAIEALEAARKMPPGKEKSEALKKAGTLRNIAYRRGVYFTRENKIRPQPGEAEAVDGLSWSASVRVQPSGTMRLKRCWLL